MAEYVDRDLLLDGMAGLVPYWIDDSDEQYLQGLTSAYNLICNAPSADVRPVVRGKNATEEYDEVDQFICSECGIILEGYIRKEVDEDDGDETYHEYRFNYCPNCGANVIGDRNES